MQHDPGGTSGMGPGEIVAPAASQQVEIPGVDSDRPLAVQSSHYVASGVRE